MPRIRSIKPEFFTSEVVCSLPLRARLTWIGLWTHCDNFGRCKDNSKLIKAAVWPLDDVSIKDIESDLNTLADCRLIVRYTVAGKPYLAIANWTEHQYGANKGEPKWPGPHEADPCLEKSGQDLDESESDSDQSGPNQGSGVRGQDGKGAHSREPDPFDEFWTTYPRRAAKPDAGRAWAKAVKVDAPEIIIKGAARYRDDPNRDPAFTMLPATWLNRHAWNDDPQPPRNGSPKPQQQSFLQPWQK